MSSRIDGTNQSHFTECFDATKQHKALFMILFEHFIMSPDFFIFLMWLYLLYTQVLHVSFHVHGTVPHYIVLVIFILHVVLLHKENGKAETLETCYCYCPHLVFPTPSSVISHVNFVSLIIAGKLKSVQERSDHTVKRCKLTLHIWHMLVLAWYSDAQLVMSRLGSKFPSWCIVSLIKNPIMWFFFPHRFHSFSLHKKIHTCRTKAWTLHCHACMKDVWCYTNGKAKHGIMTS